MRIELPLPFSCPTWAFQRETWAPPAADSKMESVLPSGAHENAMARKSPSTWEGVIVWAMLHVENGVKWLSTFIKVLQSSKVLRWWYFTKAYPFHVPLYFCSTRFHFNSEANTVLWIHNFVFTTVVSSYFALLQCKVQRSLFWPATTLEYCLHVNYNTICITFWMVLWVHLLLIVYFKYILLLII